MTEVIGWQLHLIVLPIVFAVVVVLGLLGIWFAASVGDGFWATFVAGCVGVVLLCIGGLWIAACVPFNGKYWELYRVTGTVDTVSNGFVDGGGDQTFLSYVVTLEDDDRPYLLTDPRASQLDGSEVELTCTIEWVYQGGDRWNCVIGEVTQ